VSRNAHAMPLIPIRRVVDSWRRATSVRWVTSDDWRQRSKRCPQSKTPSADRETGGVLCSGQHKEAVPSHEQHQLAISLGGGRFLPPHNPIDAAAN
jgi:hypothetical protein